MTQKFRVSVKALAPMTRQEMPHLLLLSRVLLIICSVNPTYKDINNRILRIYPITQDMLMVPNTPSI
jgi:hypothetical protein